MYHYICRRNHHVESDRPVRYPAWDQLPTCPWQGCREALYRVSEPYVSYFRFRGMAA